MESSNCRDLNYISNFVAIFGKLIGPYTFVEIKESSKYKGCN